MKCTVVFPVIFSISFEFFLRLGIDGWSFVPHTYVKPYVKLYKVCTRLHPTTAHWLTPIALDIFYSMCPRVSIATLERLLVLGYLD